MENKKTRVLFISGGGNKTAFMASVAIHLITNKDIKFKYFVGISSGAILSILLAMGEYDAIQNQKKLFKISHHPLFPSLRALWNVLIGKTFLYNDNTIRTRLKSIITRDKFNRWKKDLNSPDCTIMVVDINTSEELMIDLKSEDYENAIGYVLASASRPMFVPGKKINGRLLYGGIRSSIGTSWLKYHHTKVQECYAIYSRTNDLSDITWSVSKSKGVNIVQLLERVTDIMSIEIGKSDYQEFGDLCHKHIKRCENIFAPFKLIEMEDEKDMWNLGIDLVEKNPRLWKKL